MNEDQTSFWNKFKIGYLTCVLLGYTGFWIYVLISFFIKWQAKGIGVALLHLVIAYIIFFILKTLIPISWTYWKKDK